MKKNGTAIELEEGIMFRAFHTPGFPFTEVTHEFLRKIPVDKVHLEWKSPKFTDLMRWCVGKLGWEEEYAIQKVSQTCARWVVTYGGLQPGIDCSIQSRINCNLQSKIGMVEGNNKSGKVVGSLELEEVVKKCVRGGTDSYVVSWRIDGQALQTIEPALMVAASFPSCVAALEEKKLAKLAAKKKPRKVSKKNAADAKSKSAANVKSKQLQIDKMLMMDADKKLIESDLENIICKQLQIDKMLKKEADKNLKEFDLENIISHSNEKLRTNSKVKNSFTSNIPNTKNLIPDDLARDFILSKPTISCTESFNDSNTISTDEQRVNSGIICFDDYISDDTEDESSNDSEDEDKDLSLIIDSFMTNIKMARVKSKTSSNEKTSSVSNGIRNQDSEKSDRDGNNRRKKISQRNIEINSLKENCDPLTIDKAVQYKSNLFPNSNLGHTRYYESSITCSKSIKALPLSSGIDSLASRVSNLTLGEFECQPANTKINSSDENYSPFITKNNIISNAELLDEPSNSKPSKNMPVNFNLLGNSWLDSDSFLNSPNMSLSNSPRVNGSNPNRNGPEMNGAINNSVTNNHFDDSNSNNIINFEASKCSDEDCVGNDEQGRDHSGDEDDSENDSFINSSFNSYRPDEFTSLAERLQMKLNMKNIVDL